MQRLLMALSYPMLILSGALLYHVFSSGPHQPLPTWRVVLEIVAALALAVVGFAGIRMRHRPPQ